MVGTSRRSAGDGVDRLPRLVRARRRHRVPPACVRPREMRMGIRHAARRGVPSPGVDVHRDLLPPRGPRRPGPVPRRPRVRPPGRLGRSRRPRGPGRSLPTIRPSRRDTASGVRTRPATGGVSDLSRRHRRCWPGHFARGQLPDGVGRCLVRDRQQWRTRDGPLRVASEWRTLGVRLPDRPARALPGPGLAGAPEARSAAPWSRCLCLPSWPCRFLCALSSSRLSTVTT